MYNQLKNYCNFISQEKNRSSKNCFEKHKNYSDQTNQENKTLMFSRLIKYRAYPAILIVLNLKSSAYDLCFSFFVLNYYQTSRNKYCFSCFHDC